eukprot:4018639-Prymnesium_polylepis.1
MSESSPGSVGWLVGVSRAGENFTPTTQTRYRNVPQFALDLSEKAEISLKVAVSVRRRLASAIPHGAPAPTGRAPTQQDYGKRYGGRYGIRSNRGLLFARQW